ncbi:MAG: IS256 family transposase [Clostridia bacterium]|nr:IS256 family transposase [Clostridia bacterium]
MPDNIVQLNTELIQRELKDLVKNSVEETLNAMLDAEADRLVNAERYARDEERQGYRAGHYDRSFTTSAGEVNLRMPKLKGVAFETAIIERYRRRETSVEEALIEMYLAGVSVRRIEDITEALWGTKVSPGTISNLNKRAYENIEKWRNRPLEGKYPYIYVDGIFLKRCWGGEYENASVLIAIGVTEDGYREILGAAEGLKEDLESWKNFFVWLKSRGLNGVKLVIGDKALGMVESVGQVFPDAKYQRCTVHFYRNVLSSVPNQKVGTEAKMLKAIHAQEDKAAAREKAKQVIEKLQSMKIGKAARTVETGFEETLTFMSFPAQHWLRIRTNNALERLNREIKRRTKVVGTFPDGESALMLVCARLRHVASSEWGSKRYLNMEHLKSLILSEEGYIAG